MVYLFYSYFQKEFLVTQWSCSWLINLWWYAVKLGPKISDTVKGKLSLGARILQVGGVEKVFMQLFSVKNGEKLLKASQCYISTTSGPLAGLLFISTHKVSFCSERSIKAYSSNGHLIRIHYKVSHTHYTISLCCFSIHHL